MKYTGYFQNIKTSTLLFFVMLSLSCTEAKTLKNLESYQAKFDYKRHPREREIVYQHFIKTYGLGDYHPLRKEEIGIDLYDLNNDGEKEILVYLDNIGYCGSGGCAFLIFKKEKRSNEKYSEALYITAYNAIKILRNTTNRFHDLLLEEHEGRSIWMWKNGKYVRNKFITGDIRFKH